MKRQRFKETNFAKWSARRIQAQLPVVVRINKSLQAPKVSSLWVDDGWVKLLEAPDKMSLDTLTASRG